MDGTTGSVPQVSSTGCSSAALTEAPSQTTEKVETSPVGAALLCQAHSLLDRLWGSREMALYIDRGGSYGTAVHAWLTRYSEAQLGRGFARPNHADLFAELETAADELVDAQLTHDGEGRSACKLCHRATVGGVLGHAESCVAGKLYSAIAAVREELVGFDADPTLPDGELNVEVELEGEAE